MAPGGDSASGEVGVVLAVAGRRIVVISPDERGAPIAITLARHGAHVTLVSADAGCVAASRATAFGESASILERCYVRGDLAGAFAAVCFETGETAVAVASEAEAISCLVHIVDHPELSSFRFADGWPSPTSEESA